MSRSQRTRSDKSLAVDTSWEDARRVAVGGRLPSSVSRLSGQSGLSETPSLGRPLAELSHEIDREIHRWDSGGKRRPY